MSERARRGAVPSYREACEAFSWDAGLAAFDWIRRDTVSLGETLVDRHARSDRPALDWVGKDGARRAVSFAELSQWSRRFAGVLRDLGVRCGDRVAGYLPRVPETLAAMLGAWNAGAIYVPIFTGFGPDAIAYRVGHSRASVLCTHWEYAARVPDPLPGAARLVVVDRAGAPTPNATSFWPAVDAQENDGEPERVRRDEPAVLLYTSGSTGPPKGVEIAANFPLAVYPYLVYGLDLRTDDVFWPTGDPGWGYGLVCYALALASGVTVHVDEAAPTAERSLQRLADLGVTNFATTPTLLRGIMALGADAVRASPVRVRAVSSCGEPLNAEVVQFFRKHWGVTVMDHYGSSEVGLPIGNANALDEIVKPGSMGRPFPGATAAIIDDEGRELPEGDVGHLGVAPHAEGYYALGYWDDPERTRALRRGRWLTSGDHARRDADGYFWFEGRADDVIKSAGYRIGPFEVESALLAHPAIAEAAVVGVPDALRGHVVKAYVVLRPGAARPDALEAELADLVRAHVGRPQVPRIFEVLPELPKTESGKIQRFQLRRRSA